MTKLGAFDAWVQDQQERSMRDQYEEYLEDGDTAIPPHEWPASAMSFEEYCAEKISRERACGFMDGTFCEQHRKIEGRQSNDG